MRDGRERKRGQNKRKMTPLHQVPVLRPLLPAAADLMPYLEKIDATRWYSNMGPLARAFEARLADHFGAPADCVVTSANGTLAMVQTLLALGARPGSLCVMPSWTFVASAAAAHTAGLRPYFVDVNPATWAMEPSAVEALLAKGLDVGAVMPVAPFGAPLNLAAWETFQAGSSIPVLVDAAAGFDSFADVATTLPFMVSLHATKVFGVGEGAVIVCPDAALANDVRQAGNFGFRGSREAQVPGFNAKLSEYAAAIGLAGFERWPRTRAAWRDITERFARKTARTPGVKDSPGFGDHWISSYGMVELPSGHHARRVCDVLARRGVETRQWWGEGCHTQAAYRDCPRTALPHTEDLADRTLGLPFWLGLDDAQLDYVFDGLAEAVEAVG